jgi:DeoR/GlpR family transcriptional regulator of sugar metabolism
MRWAEKQRRMWICDFIAKNGQINRADIMREFEISLPQASNDLTKLRKEFPALLIYNTSKKRYETSEATDD